VVHSGGPGSENLPPPVLGAALRVGKEGREGSEGEGWWLHFPFVVVGHLSAG
jgi:hypothetical protein